MKIIHKPLLHEFMEKYPDTAEWLKAWLVKVSEEIWDVPADILRSFPKAEFKEPMEVAFISLTKGYLLTVNIHYLARIVAIKSIDPLRTFPDLPKTMDNFAKGDLHVHN